MTLEEVVTAFELDLRRLGRSPVTIETYTRCARKCLASTGRDDAALTREDVRQFVANSVPGKAPLSTAALMVRVRALTRFLAQEGLVPEDPATDLYASRASPRPPQCLASISVRELLKTAAWIPCATRLNACVARALSQRDTAIVELLCLGLRASEVGVIRIQDLDLVAQALSVRPAKRGRPRSAPLPPAAIEPLRVWVAEGRPVLVDAESRDALLVSRRGRPLDGDAVWQIVRRVAGRCDLRTHPHALRRWFATGLVRAGANLEVVRQALGHARLSTTAVYVDAEREDLRRSVEAISFTRALPDRSHRGQHSSISSKSDDGSPGSGKSAC